LNADPGLYDDGGFTGANMDRPALQRLLADIAADRVDCVVVYKVDRLSRSSKLSYSIGRFSWRISSPLGRPHSTVHRAASTSVEAAR
jgi:hypothetical protein